MSTDNCKAIPHFKIIINNYIQLRRQWSTFKAAAYLTAVQSPSVVHTNCIDSRSQNLTVLIHEHNSVISHTIALLCYQSLHCTLYNECTHSAHVYNPTCMGTNCKRTKSHTVHLSFLHRKFVLAWISRPHRTTTFVDAAYCYRPSSMVCRSVTLVRPAKMAEPIKMPFWLWSSYRGINERL